MTNIQCNVNNQLNHWYSLWLISGKTDSQAAMNYKFYKSQFKFVQRLLIEKKNKEMSLNLSKIYKTDKNTFWKIVKKHKSKKINKNFKSTNTLNIRAFEEFYSHLFSHEDIEEKASHKLIHEEVRYYYDIIKEEKFETEITNNLIESCLKKLKNNKAVGNDMICNEMLKNAKCLRLTSLLKQIFQDIINEGVILENFNISIITPIEKKDSANKHPEDLRPISVSNTFSTIFEMTLLNKMDHIFQFNNKQFGYKANTSCKHASFIINETLSYYKKGDSPCYVISLDMKKAFDRMWCDGLFSKLKDKIEKSIWRALVNYYSVSKGKVKINNEFSNEFVIKEGVKQGGILSPYLFIS